MAYAHDSIYPRKVFSMNCPPGGSVQKSPEVGKSLNVQVTGFDTRYLGVDCRVNPLSPLKIPRSRVCSR